MGDDLASNIVPGVRGDSVFDSITSCVTFDRKNFGKDISIFERALEHSDRLIHIQKATHGDDRVDTSSDDEDCRGKDEKNQPQEEGDDVRTQDPFERANVIRKRNRIKVSGSAPPAPMTNFDHLLGSEEDQRRMNTKRLVHNIKAEFDMPTAVQKQVIPAMFQDERELMVVAPTGSGKTLAFLIPLILRVKMQKSQAPDSNGIRALILSPTKELSMQTGRVLMPLLPGLKIRCSVLSKSTAAGCDFNNKVDILLANPLRLESMAREGKIDLSAVETLVLDEADKLFEMGFSEQIDACLAACTHKNIVRSLFSATLPESVELLARSVLRDPLRITVGERNISATSVHQKLLFVGRENGKLLAIRQLIRDGLRPPVLIFVNTKDKANEVHKELMFEGVHVDSLHASQSHAAREKAVERFRDGTTWVLIATDLVARGLDFAGVETVINLDFPNSTVDYVHRVGRTGRAGSKGQAVTFFTEDDVDKLRGVANVIKAAGGEVDPWMLKLRKVRNRRRTEARVGTSVQRKEDIQSKKRQHRNPTTKA